MGTPTGETDERGLMSTSPAPRGTYRAEDGTPVEFADALKVWTRIAYERLQQVATHYNGLITYKELAQHVQRESGIHTSSTPANMVGKILELCAVQAASAGDPPLTSLCLKTDGTVGTAYWRTPIAEGLTMPELVGEPDVEADAAEHRLMCYRAYATDLPESGGVARIPEQVIVRRERADRAAERTRAAKREDEPQPVCPSCFTQLPASGVCWPCD